MSSRCPRTRGSFSSGWRSRTSIASTASRRRSPSGRRTASATRARRSARRPRSTTTCGCCTRASAARSAATAAARWCARRRRWSRPNSAALPPGTRLLIGFDLPIVGDRFDDAGRRRTRDEVARADRRRTGVSEVHRVRKVRRVRFGPGRGGRHRRAEAKGLRPAAHRRPRGLVRRRGGASAGRPADAPGRRRSRAARRRGFAAAAHRFDRDVVSRRRRRRVGGRTAVSSRPRQPPQSQPEPLFTSSPSGSSAGRAASRTRIRSRGCSRSTTRSARAPTCHGFGNIIELDINLVVPDQSKSIQQGAIEPWTKPHYRAQLAELKKAARGRKIRLDVPWSALTAEEQQFVIDGGRRGGWPRTTRASAGSSAGSSGRNTRCTSACS